MSRAENYLKGYTPKDERNHDQMLTAFRSAAEDGGVEGLKACSLLFIFDLSYDRGDLSHALKAVELEYGVHVG